MIDNSLYTGKKKRDGSAKMTTQSLRSSRPLSASTSEPLSVPLKKWTGGKKYIYREKMLTLLPTDTNDMKKKT